MTDAMMTELLTFVAELKQVKGPEDVPPPGPNEHQTVHLPAPFCALAPSSPPPNFFTPTRLPLLPLAARDTARLLYAPACTYARARARARAYGHMRGLRQAMVGWVTEGGM
jgi:hypothetical protein